MEPVPAKEVNEFHQKDDLDSSHRAHHHTLGFGPNQAAPGNHTHDGVTSPPIPPENLTGVVKSVTSIAPEIVVDNTDPMNPVLEFNRDITYELREQEAAFTNADADILPPLAIRRNPTTGRVYLVRNT